MCLIAYHASHEQFNPRDLLNYIQLAEAAGFTAIHSSDHFHPWSKQQGQSGFTLSWLGAAMQATKLPFSMVCAPGQRLHPAIVAQAIATIENMFPGRFIMELGSGEALNETITGEQWPEKPVRNERLLQCKQIISRLLQGEKVNYTGLVKVRNAQLYTLPDKVPPLFCAALSKETAAWAGSWADGLLTTADEDLGLTQSKLSAFNANGGKNKPVHLQMAFCYGRTRREAVDQAWDQWRSNLVGLDALANWASPEEFDAAGAAVTREEIVDQLTIITDMDELKYRLLRLKALKPACIHLHNFSRNQKDYLEDMGEVLRGVIGEG